MFSLLIEALGTLFTPGTFILLLLGVVVGISVGILPGLGGTVGMSLLLPFVFGLRGDPAQAIALLMGMAAVIHTSDTFPSVLLGVPGSSGSQATIMDGYPLAKQGQATRALAAAFFSSMVGGIIGAFVLILVLPVARPVVLKFGPPEQFMLAVLGLSMVAILAGKRPMRGLMAGAMGLLIGAISAAPNQPDVFRYSFDQPYLWRGIPLAVLALGLFAVPEMLTLLASRSSIVDTGTKVESGQVLTGFRDVIKNKFLVARSAVLGVLIGFIPGLGGSVVDWISYGAARQSIPDERFGHGDIRGVIAPESSNNAKEGGALIPTLLFGIPGSGTTAVLLSAFVVLGLTPGRAMVDPNKDLSTTVLIVATLAVANVFGALACLSITKGVSKVAQIKAARLVPFVLAVMLVGSYQSSTSWGDLLAMIVIGALGWFMVQLKFPLPPLLIGFVLSDGVERNMFLSNGAKQLRELPTYSWLVEPIVLAIGAASVVLAVVGYRANQRAEKRTAELKKELAGEETTLAVEKNVLATLVFLGVLFCIFLYAGIEATTFREKAAPFPIFVSFSALLITVIEVVSYVRTVRINRREVEEENGEVVPFLDQGETPFRQSVRSVARFVVWIAALYLGIWLVSIPLAVTIFIGLFLVFEGELSWWKALLFAAGALIFLTSLEDIMSLRWPAGQIFDLPEFFADWFPEKLPLINRLA